MNSTAYRNLAAFKEFDQILLPKTDQPADSEMGDASLLYQAVECRYRNAEEPCCAYAV